MEGYFGSKQFNKEHPLTPLLDHEDNDGYIAPEDCKRIADALKQMLPNIEFAPIDPEDQEMFIEITIDFIAGCNDAFEKYEDLIFI
jgi:hypothetical protein